MTADKILEQIESQTDLRLYINKDQLRELRAHCADKPAKAAAKPKKPAPEPEPESVQEPETESEETTKASRSRKRRG